MFADDIALVGELIAKHGPAQPPFVECGGLEDPVIAAYDKTIEAMAALRDEARWCSEIGDARDGLDVLDSGRVRAAQMCRYLQIHRPLEAICPGYICEDPATGGVPIDGLAEKYRNGLHNPGGIGTAILLSVLEHVAEPWNAINLLHRAMKPGGVVIVSVPWIFPHHPSPEDHWRFSPSALKILFTQAGDARWEILACDWRLQIDASQGVLDLRTGKPQAIESCFIAARAVR